MMNRHVSTKWITNLSGEIVVVKKDGTKETTSIKKGDVLENVRFIESEEVISVTGRIAGFNATIRNIPNARNTDFPVDTVKDDIVITHVIIDTSEKYNSNFIRVTAKEIIENEGIPDVVKVNIIPKLSTDLIVSTTDGNEVKENEIKDLKVGSVIPNFTIRKDNNKIVTINATVAKFLYKPVSVVGNENGIRITNIVVKDENGKVHNAKLFDIVSIIDEVKEDTVEEPDEVKPAVEEVNSNTPPVVEEPEVLEESPTEEIPEVEEVNVPVGISRELEARELFTVKPEEEKKEEAVDHIPSVEVKEETSTIKENTSENTYEPVSNQGPHYNKSKKSKKKVNINNYNN